MFVFWRGYGIIVVGVFLVVAFCAIQVTEFVGAEEKVGIERDWPSAVGMIIIGLILVPLGCRMNGRATKEIIEFDRFPDDFFDGNHTFFFLAVEYWGILSLLLGAILFMKPLF